jgi:hypothetical protein
MVDGQCTCDTSCEANCENRRSQVDCDETNCRNGDNCGNRPQATKWKVEPFNTTNNRGRGLRSCQHIPSGEIILRWEGAPVTGKELRDAEDNGSFVMAVENGIHVVAAPDLLANYINHSCEPNCEFVKREANGYPVVYVQSTTEIGEGVELTVHYGKRFMLRGERVPCLCGCSTCLGYIGARPAEISTACWPVDGKTYYVSVIPLEAWIPEDLSSYEHEKTHLPIIWHDGEDIPYVSSLEIIFSLHANRRQECGLVG